MAISNRERVSRGLDLLRAGLAPFVEREVHEAVRKRTIDMGTIRRFVDDPMLGSRKIAEWDAAGLLKLLWESWNEVFAATLGRAERAQVAELREVRNRWAHQEPFSSDDTDRALDSMERLLSAVSAPQAEEVRKLKMELRRQVYEEQARQERRRLGAAIDSPATGGLTPWREVVTPHPDVASGRYQEAEFAADLAEVQAGTAGPEYRDPAEFFRRTYPTAALRRLLANAIRRLTGAGGDPVVQLQTSFGGGKTHAMLALYHLTSGRPIEELPGVEAIMAEEGLGRLPEGVRRVVLVGTRLSPGQPWVQADGTVVRTLWGELAWQLGGRAAFERVRAADETATNPGGTLVELLRAYQPALVLIDEWVAYARQLHDERELPGGTFETHFTFAQALTEAVRAVPRALLVVSLPASDSANAEDEEVGGARGREALRRLRNVIGRLETPWSPATAEESFEIVRRRLFEPITRREQFTARDNVARAFAELYRSQPQEFPSECREADYEQRLRAAYPIHPELFDRLYRDWSTLVRFQRTRGVLRLMAAVIHALWRDGDRNALILPGLVPIDEPRVRDMLTGYLPQPEVWKPIVDRDVDGPDALPLRFDKELPNLGQYAATRRVARTVFLGSAPHQGVAHRGIEHRRIRLGCALPGEPLAVFGDALRRLAGEATYLYQDGSRYWYATQPTVTRLAEDRAAQFARERDRLHEAIRTRLKANLRDRGRFPRIHLAPQGPGDVEDDPELGLVVLGPDRPHGRSEASKALEAARELLEKRGNAPRLCRNALVFLAADETRLGELEGAVARHLAWSSIVQEHEELNLDPQQKRQAEQRAKEWNDAVEARLPEAYAWLLVPEQPQPTDPEIRWQTLRLAGQAALAPRALKRLEGGELVVARLAGSRLRMELDRVPLWRGDHVALRELAEDFARYLYLPRLLGPEVLREAVRDGLRSLTWDRDGFAWADAFDEREGRHRGLRCGPGEAPSAIADSGLLVRPEVALRQRGSDTSTVSPPGTVVGPTDKHTAAGSGATAGTTERPVLRRYHASVRIPADRVGRKAAEIAEEVVAHLAGCAEVEVTLDISARAGAAEGFPDRVVQIVRENGRQLGFTANEFESG
ncbi:MAG: DUF499 domain-containing protein [Geminicoccaceae bacterium]|nr:DUF499 domain-containing protein [Geminicoccaceae bacterium]